MRERKVEKGKNPLKENVIDNTWAIIVPLLFVWSS